MVGVTAVSVDIFVDAVDTDIVWDVVSGLSVVSCTEEDILQDVVG